MWRSKLQSVVANSSAEAECIAMSACVREVVFARQLLHELGAPCTSPTKMHVDNDAAIAIATNAGFTQRSKSIRICFHNVGLSVAAEEVALEPIRSQKNPADVLTKTVSRAVHVRHLPFLLATET